MGGSPEDERDMQLRSVHNMWMGFDRRQRLVAAVRQVEVGFPQAGDGEGPEVDSTLLYLGLRDSSGMQIVAGKIVDAVIQTLLDPDPTDSMQGLMKNLHRTWTCPYQVHLVEGNSNLCMSNRGETWKKV
jgi:hypothetical protein